MDDLEGKLRNLRRFNGSLQRRDRKLSEAVNDLMPSDTLEGVAGLALPEHAIVTESIILRRGRPVLAVRDNAVQLAFDDPADGAVWEARLRKAEPFLDRAIRATGRINLMGSALDWVGTGWLVAEDIIVTNRHVAQEFARQGDDGFAFRVEMDGPIDASVDFLQEIDNPATLAFRLLKPLHIEPLPGPDVAFFAVEVMDGDAALARPLDLARRITQAGHVATIGYPAFDSRIPDLDLMEEIYGNVYNKKRVAPGGVTHTDEVHLLHNCTTLGGNSGSAILDLDTGEALGLHFSGRFLDTNYAVRADVVRALLDGLGKAAPSTSQTPSPKVAQQTTPVQQNVQYTAAGGMTVTIPLIIDIKLGDISTSAPVATPAPAAPVEDDLLDDDTESIADYRTREGYRPDFLGGEGFACPLPTVTRNADQVLTFDDNGETATELKYEHFSVVMNRPRRLCLFSAVNLDGGQSRRTKRKGWRWDPRIPKAQQIRKECYGNPPKFSRGHMTRREDPAWGDEETATRGNRDSMHVTNAVPQIQAFNSPIWLGLEDYALDHAREDDMRISVFTGPYFDDADPERYGVRIPLKFWKIIAFIHDHTGKLSATGYEMDQEKSLPDDNEFVFGAFKPKQTGVTVQVPIARIEAISGLSFGPLAALDPLAAGNESVCGGALSRLEQIRFA